MSGLDQIMKTVRIFTFHAVAVAGLMLAAMAAKAAPDPHAMSQLGAGPGIEAPAMRAGATGTQSPRLAQKYEPKFEVPKAPKAPEPPAPPPYIPPTYTPPAYTPPPYTPQPAPAPRPRSGGATMQNGLSGFSGCEACRKYCYNTLHGTRQFSPCMKGCWNKYCRP